MIKETQTREKKVKKQEAKVQRKESCKDTSLLKFFIGFKGISSYIPHCHL